ncbi:MAG: hypothetical protein RL748_296, partial [Pseudomonadota bacterium]
MFQSSPAPKRGCHASKAPCHLTAREFQSSPAPKRGCHLSQIAQPVPKIVSILTRAEARMSPRNSFALRGMREFQSSPAPKRGCHRAIGNRQGQRKSFNPHPRRSADVTTGNDHVVLGDNVSILTRAEARMSRRLQHITFKVDCRFNPHPRRSADVTKPFCKLNPTVQFQSSPAPKRGCHTVSGYGWTGGRQSFNP